MPLMPDDMDDAILANQTEIAALKSQVAALVAAPASGGGAISTAFMSLNGALYAKLLAAPDEAGQLAILDGLTASLVAP